MLSNRTVASDGGGETIALESRLLEIGCTRMVALIAEPFDLQILQSRWRKRKLCWPGANALEQRKRNGANAPASSVSSSVQIGTRLMAESETTKPMTFRQDHHEGPDHPHLTIRITGPPDSALWSPINCLSLEEPSCQLPINY
jgi:hypothetical protein